MQSFGFKACPFCCVTVNNFVLSSLVGISGCCILIDLKIWTKSSVIGSVIFKYVLKSSVIGLMIHEFYIKSSVIQSYGLLIYLIL